MGSEKERRIQAITDECLDRISRGEAFDIRRLLEENRDLLPELQEQLEKLEDIAAAQQDLKQAAGKAGVDDQQSGRLRVRCPNCHCAIEISVDVAWNEVTCSQCGSSISLVQDDQLEADALTETRIGHFDLEKQLGFGAFGTVWKAYDSALDRTVALKIPRKRHLDPDEAERFLREARAAAQLDHPGIVALHEVGRHEDCLFIVSDFVAGVTLSDWMDVEQPDHQRAATLVMQMAQAVEHAHKRGVIHRDLKPSNVMINEEGQPRILDFGFAKRLAQSR